MEKLTASLERLPEGVDFPGWLFTRLAGDIPLTKAALLLPDPESGDFLPWASAGLERSTVRRLRLPSDLIVEDMPLEAGKAESLLRSHLSSREWDLAVSFLLIPLKKKATMLGYILITDAPFLNEADPDLAGWESAAARWGNLLYRHRVSRLDRMPPPVDNLPESWPARTALVRIGLADYLDLTVERFPTLDRYRLYRDFLRILASLVSRLGRSYPLGRESVLLALDETRLDDTDLFLHQVGLSFRRFLGQGRELPELEKQVLILPDGGPAPASFLNAPPSHDQDDNT